jgi:hypothetical protein
VRAARSLPVTSTVAALMLTASTPDPCGQLEGGDRRRQRATMEPGR